MAFDKKTRNLLQRTVTACRRLLDGEFTAQLQELYGIQPEGALAPAAALNHLGDEELAVARLLRERINHLEGGSATQALTRTSAKPEHIARVIREQAFTVLNRLAALRLCEERGLVLECVRQGVNSEGFQLFTSSAGNALGETHEAYRVYLHCLFDELALDLGVLFDRFSPLALLFPRHAALTEVLSELNGSGKAAERDELPPEQFAQIWQADETIGWIYQYYNDETERKKMREESAAPRNSRELAVRNQFFTPRYVVEFLTDNSLGRIWYEMTAGNTSLKEHCRYLVRRPNEYFLTNSSRYFRNSRPGFLAQGLANLPENPNWDEIQAVALSLEDQPHEVSKSLGLGDCKEFAERQEHEYRQTGKYAGTAIELLCCLFIEQRNWHWAGYGDQPSADWLKRAETIYQALRAALSGGNQGGSQEALLEQPVFIPYRPIKDPRTILMLDPACGSMHFGLYAFDLFERIYVEAWHHPEIGKLLQADYGVRAPNPPKLDLASVRLKAGAALRCALSGRNLAVEEAVVALKAFDQKSREVRGTPVLCHREEAERRRGQYRHAFPLTTFSFPEAIAKDWFSQPDAQRFLQETGAFDFELIQDPPSASPEEAYVLFKRDVPRLIIEHNLHGIDIDPRCAQIAGLSLWLRAQRAWKDMGIAPAQRPPIKRSNIVCAEPMPGEKELLREFVEREFPATERGVVLRMLETIFDKMQLAGEAGSLLKIEEEIRSAIEDARDAWQKFATKPRELFTTAELNQISTAPELTGLEQAVSSGPRHLTTDFWERIEERIYAALRDFAEQAENGGGFQRRLFAEDAARGFAFIDVCRKRYDVVVMNPPFGASTDSIKALLAQSYFAGRTDLYACSILRALEISSPQGAIGAITARTGFFLQSFAEWRTGLLGSTSVCCFADLGGDVLDSAMVETAAYALHKGHLGIAPFFRIEGDDKADGILGAINGLSTGLSGQTTFLRNPQDFSNMPDKAWSYWLPSDLAAVVGQHKSFDPHFGDIRLGVQTNDDFRFSRLWWEVPPDLIGDSASAVEHGKGWVTFLKGGDSTKYFADISMVLNWFGEGNELKEAITIALVGGHWSRHIQSLECYFLPGVSWALRTDNFDPHLVPAGCISSVSRYFAIPRRVSIAALLGVWNCRLFNFLAKLRMEKWLQPKFVIGVVKDLPFPSLSSASQRDLEEKVLNIWALKCGVSRSDETSRYAVVPEFGVGQQIKVESLNSTIQGDTTVGLIAELERDAERIVTTEFGYSSSQLGAVFSGLATVKTKQSDSQEKQVQGALSFAFGGAFGRWDIRYATGEQAAPELPDPFAPLPVCPPGQLQNTQGLPACPEHVPAAYPVRIPWDGILVDDPNHPLDLERRVREVIEIIWAGPTDHRPLVTDHSSTTPPEAIEAEACQILGVNSLRDYFRRPSGFFADHLQRYSKSRRQAPIYWPLSTTSGSYTLWIYYHRLTPDTLYKCLQQFVIPKLADVEKELAHLRAVLAANEGGAKERKRLEELEDLRRELIELRTELELWAPRWKPNLNDGVLITAAPLWKLFRLPKWQKDLKTCWQELEKGDYDWAHLAYTLWPDRVREKCKTDRSLAIAHGLEALCAVKAPVKKVKKAKKQKEQMDWEAADP